MKTCLGLCLGGDPSQCTQPRSWLAGIVSQPGTITDAYFAFANNTLIFGFTLLASGKARLGGPKCLNTSTGSYCLLGGRGSFGVENCLGWPGCRVILHTCCTANKKLTCCLPAIIPYCVLDCPRLCSHQLAHSHLFYLFRHANGAMRPPGTR